MSLLSNSGPSLAFTHEPIPIAEMIKFKDMIVQKAINNHVTLDMLRDIASKNSIPLEHLYASLAQDPNLILNMENEVLIAICVGSCQRQGAIKNLEILLQLQKEREDNHQNNFDIIPRNCLDLCAHAPVCIARSKDGQAVLPKLKPEDIKDTISQLCCDD